MSFINSATLKVGRYIDQFPHIIILEKSKINEEMYSFESFDMWTSWTPVKNGSWLNDKVVVGFENNEDRLTFILKYVGDGKIG